MEKTLLTYCFILGSMQYALAQRPILGTYSPVSIPSASGNASILPNAPPQNTISLTATVIASFKGLLHVSPITGIFTIMDAYPVGSYVITVKASNGGFSSVSSFLLTVNNSGCSQALFTGTETVAVQYHPHAVAMGAFNGDGKQDFATANPGANSVSIHLGDGPGNFSE